MSNLGNSVKKERSGLKYIYSSKADSNINLGVALEVQLKRVDNI